MVFPTFGVSISAEVAVTRAVGPVLVPVSRGVGVKNSEEIMEILEAFDASGSYRAAAELAGCDHHTVRRYVALRAQGQPAERAEPETLIGAFLPKLEELVERADGKIRADVAHDKLTAMGYAGSPRTTRRAVAVAKRAYRSGHRRVYRPWIPEPGLWLQFDWGEGPRIAGRRTYLFCAWLAWSRFRVVLPAWDRTLATLLACLDLTLRRIGGVPTYVLTDNEKTVTVDHVATVPVRHPEIVAASRHYGLTVHTCYPADPESKGGSESTVRLAKADLVPTSANLRGSYGSFTELAQACQAFCEQVNGREHRETGRAPVEALTEERSRLHPVVEQPYAAAFGQTRRVGWESTVSFSGVRYSVPHQLIDERVWVRLEGDEVVIVHHDRTGPVEVARHPRGAKGRPQIQDEHYPARTSDPTRREPRARSAEDAEFLAIGDGAAQWLEEAAAAGTTRVRSKMGEAVSLAKLYGHPALDQALGTAALAGRFGETDLASILTHQRQQRDPGRGGEPIRASEEHSLQSGTAAWAHFGKENNS